MLSRALVLLALPHASDTLAPKIVAIVRERPGLTITGLYRLLGTGWGNLYHHLAALEAAGTIQVIRAGRRRFIYSDEPNVDATGADILAGQTCRMIAEAVVNEPGISAAALARRVDQSPRVVYYHVRRLREAEMITSVSATRLRGLIATERLIDRLRDRARAADPPQE